MSKRLKRDEASLLELFRRRGAPLALMTYTVFLGSIFPRTAYAEPPAPEAEVALPEVSSKLQVPTSPTPSAGTSVPKGVAADLNAGEQLDAKDVQNAKLDDKVVVAPPPPDEPQKQLSLPTGKDKSGVSSQSISVPQGAGKIEGMGESFSTQLSTGVATFNVPFALPKARGAVGASLALGYSSSSGHGNAGVGWDIGFAYIARQSDKGLPSFQDPGPGVEWTPQQDHFVFGGGQELVPICLVEGQTCTRKLADEVMPAWASGWRYFRSRVEGSFMRFFWSPDHKTWRVQSKDGTTLELGVPLDGTAYQGALETNPDDAAQIFKWCIARAFDQESDSANPAPVGNPVNLVQYRYQTSGAVNYLSDIYLTPPATNAATAAPSEYAHHVRVRWEPRPDRTFSFRRGWRTDSALRLQGVDVATKPFTGGIGAPRELLRRYHLTYDSAYHASLLQSVQVEGRCTAGALVVPTVEANEAFGVTNCSRLPAMKFDYQHVAPFTTQGTPGTADLAGYEGFDERVQEMTGSPPNSLDEEMTDLFDINSDGLPDVLVTAPGLFGGKHGVWVNGGGKFAFRTLKVNGVLGADEGVITLKNPNVAAHDLDGDGKVDLLHMPLVKTYSVYGVNTSLPQWTLDGRIITTASQQSPKLDFGKDSDRIRVVDINGDGLVDVLRSTGTEYQSFLSLGRYPGGDGQFGSAVLTSPTTATISNDPIATCTPWSATPAGFDNDDVRLADMNGDGLADIVRVRKGDIRYWPGRGTGVYGTGSLDCPAGSFGQERHIAMALSPNYNSPDLSTMRLDDVNGDGLDDLVQVRFDGVDVWLNVDGESWTPDRHIIAKTPVSPSFQNRVRLVDINGSGTRDVVWGDGNAYKYIDLAGGKRPWVLTKVSNGLGKTSEIEYATSTDLMVAAAAAGNPWKKTAPMSTHVVVRQTERDHLDLVGRPAGVYTTEYEYRDPVYDGRQREFRGFSETIVRKVGDSNSPTSLTRNTFLLGECIDDSTTAVDDCAVSERWRDNKREGLKGLPLVVDTYSEAGVYASTSVTQYTLRHLYAGLDGRSVQHAFASGGASFAYDTFPFTPAATEVDVPVVTTEDGGTTSVATVKVAKRASAGTATTSGSSVLDAFGNTIAQIANGCVDCTPVDPVIKSVSVPFRPAGDLSGWLWRTRETYVESANGAIRHRKLTSFDAKGRSVATEIDISGALPLDRHALGVATAPGASTVAHVAEVGRVETYDDFGHALFSRGANNRCTSNVLDPEYASLPVSETVYAGLPVAGSDCGPKLLTTFATYDRGLGAPVGVTGFNGEQSSVHYDEFGRTKAIYKPEPATGLPALVASVEVDYLLPSDATSQPFSRIHSRTQDGDTTSSTEMMESWAYVDGLGRAMVTLQEADQAAGDLGDWVVSGNVDYDKKGAARRGYLAEFWSGDAGSYPLSQTPSTAYVSQRYDAFGRQAEKWGLDGAVLLRTKYHALSADAWDAADIGPGPHQGTYASTRKDGHGRAVEVIERVHVGATIEARHTETTYLDTSEPLLIKRWKQGATPVVRWMRYDSQGRMVLNVEPSTSTGFNPDPSADISTIKAWRYAYDDAGELVGTSDARGCGVNFYYDAAGRVLAEDYSPCEATHATYSPPDPDTGLVTGVGAEVFYTYDTLPAGLASISVCKEETPTGCANAATVALTSPTQGKLVVVTDRAAQTVSAVDYRGRAIAAARRIAKPGPPDDDPELRFTPRWYLQTATFDAADRPIAQTTGAAVSELLGAGGVSNVTIAYSRRGVPMTLGSSYGSLVTKLVHDADGLQTEMKLGDAAGTTTAKTYDARRRLRTTQTFRAQPAIWTSPPSGYSVDPGAYTTQLLLEDTEIEYDEVDNPVWIRDWRSANEWPAGAKPVNKRIEYDDLYRVRKIQYQYGGGDDAWTSPFEAENTGSTDPRRAKPAPHVSYDKRVLEQTFAFDWLGNTTQTGDDANGFYDRSLGDITNDTYQLKHAQLAGARGGQANVKYDAAGSMTLLTVKRNGPCLPAGAICSQAYVYEWDEVGRMVRAKRWDITNPVDLTGPPSGVPEVDLAYAYDGSAERVLKTARDPVGAEVHTAYVLGSLELRRAAFLGGEYVRDELTESVYLSAAGVRVARLAYDENGSPVVNGGKVHVLFALGDHLGSTSTVIEKATGELVEKGTYLGYGSAESDYRPGRWEKFREDYRFTGKEEDVEVGLVYFGKRFLNLQMGRWASADPLAVHGNGGDLNVYAYVSGRILAAVDPLGLETYDLYQNGTNGSYSATGAPPGPNHEAVHVGAYYQGWTDEDGQEQTNYYNLYQWRQKPAPVTGPAAGEPGEAGPARPVGNGVGVGVHSMVREATGSEVAATLAAGGVETALLVGSMFAALRPGSKVGLQLGLGGDTTAQPTRRAPGKSAWGWPLEPETAKGFVKGPPASRSIARLVADVAAPPMHTKRAVAVLETRQGPTLVSGGVSPLSTEQERFARQLGLWTVPSSPQSGSHAEENVLHGAGDLGLVPTRGATSIQICATNCRPMIIGFGGRVVNQYAFEF